MSEDLMRTAYCHYLDGTSRTPQEAAAEFDKWLAQVRNDAWDKGFDRGFYDPLAGGDRDASESATTNPHEAEAQRDD